MFGGEPVLYSVRKLWIRLPAVALQQAGDLAPGGASDHDSAILPAISPPAMAESSERFDMELPVIRQAAYVGISDFWPDRTDRRDWRVDDWIRACGTPDTSETTKRYYGLPSEARLCDQVMQLLEQKLRTHSVKGVSVDLRMVGIGEATDYLRFLRRVRKAIGNSRRLIASVSGEWFCRDGLPRKVYRAAVAGFAVEDMLESVDVVVVRCWRDPLLADTGEGSLTSADFTRAAIAAATREVPCWKLAAGFMCGAVIRHESDPIEADHISAQHLEELAQRYVVRRRYNPEEDSLRIHLMSRRLQCDFWCEDAKTLSKKLAQVNRDNLVGVELFWPGRNRSLIDACRERFEPLQEFEG